MIVSCKCNKITALELLFKKNRKIFLIKVKWLVWGLLSQTLPVINSYHVGLRVVLVEIQSKLYQYSWKVRKVTRSYCNGPRGNTDHFYLFQINLAALLSYTENYFVFVFIELNLFCVRSKRFPQNLMKNCFVFGYHVIPKMMGNV